MNRGDGDYRSASTSGLLRAGPSIHLHCCAPETGFAATSDAHLTLNVPPRLLAEHVLSQVTAHVAPEPHVTVVPSPALTVQVLPAEHWTVAEAPAVSVHVAWLEH
jgi:hypothetical protein